MFFLSLSKKCLDLFFSLIFFPPGYFWYHLKIYINIKYASSKMKVNKCEGKALYARYKKMNVNESKCETFDLLNSRNLHMYNLLRTATNYGLCTEHAMLQLACRKSYILTSGLSVI